jgi:KUP system potassium uptake protein
VTGGEALFADMGHFGRMPITASWYGLVLPGLVLNYFGQGALLLAHPEAVDNPFYRLAPHWALLPLVFLSTGASIIASQALISGAFSLTHQAVQLGYVPRMRIQHTSATERGQVYVPVVNWALMVACVGLVIGFRSSSNLAAAYGVAVTLTMGITTLIFYVVVRERFGWPRPAAAALCGSFLVVDVGFFGANVPKIPHGGWFPLAVAALVFTLLTTYRTGRRLVTEGLHEERDSLEKLVAELAEHSAVRSPGTVVYMFSAVGATPPALRANLDLQRSLPERVIVLSIETEDIPKVQPVFRLKLEELGQGIEAAHLRLGFMDQPDVPAELRPKVPEVDELTYILGGEQIVVTDRGMSPWRERLFKLMHRNAGSPADYFNLPPDRTFTVARHMEL